MTAHELLAEVHKHGAVPLLVDGKLKVAPPGKLPPDLIDELRRRAGEIKAELVRQSEATRISDDTGQGEGPRPAQAMRNIFPDSRRPLISDAVRAKLERIEAEARRLGWPPELLWNSQFWGLPRGLAAVLDDTDEIAEVTPEFITILKSCHSLLRFPRRVA
jgi:hypothetical protein